MNSKFETVHFPSLYGCFNMHRSDSVVLMLLLCFEGECTRKNRRIHVKYWIKNVIFFENNGIVGQQLTVTWSIHLKKLEQITKLDNPKLFQSNGSDLLDRYSSFNSKFPFKTLDIFRKWCVIFWFQAKNLLFSKTVLQKFGQKTVQNHCFDEDKRYFQ